MRLRCVWERIPAPTIFHFIHQFQCGGFSLFLPAISKRERIRAEEMRTLPWLLLLGAFYQRNAWKIRKWKRQAEYFHFQII